MHTKERVMYMAFGCLLTLAGYILASMGSDGVAQSRGQDVIFGEIACCRLTVVNDEGNTDVLLRTDEHGGGIAIFNKGGKNVIQASVGDMGGA